MRQVGIVVFALSVAALGVMSLLSGDFALAWQPVPAWVPFRAPLAYASGAILVVCGLGLLIRRTALISVAVLTVDFIIWLLLLRIAAMTSLLDESQWLGVGETAVLVCGAWAFLAMTVDGPSRFRAAIAGSTSRRAVQLLFGVALPMIGLSHFVYSHAAVGFVPAYLPMRLGFSYFTGAAHIAAGLAVLFGVLPRLAATLEGIMMGLFGLMVWLPKVVATPASRFEWTAMLVSFAYAAASLIVAGLFKPQPLRRPESVPSPA